MFWALESGVPLHIYDAANTDPNSRLAEAAHRVTIFDTTSKTPRIHHPNVSAIDAYMPPAEDPKAKADFLWTWTLQGWQLPFGFWRGDADLGRMLEERSAEVVIRKISTKTSWF